MPDALQALLDERAIRDVLQRYCRGVDRMDRELTRACWHADGTAEYQGLFEGDADALVDWIWSAHERMQTHSHQITNCLIELAEDRAASETYVGVVLRTRPGAGGARDVLVRGRYLDRWSRRGDRWAIDHRRYVSDWTTTLAVPAGGEPGGRRDRSDPSYATFGALRTRS